MGAAAAEADTKVMRKSGSTRTVTGAIDFIVLAAMTFSCTAWLAGELSPPQAGSAVSARIEVRAP